MDGPGIGAIYRQNFELPSTAKNLPSCCVTAVKVPSKFDLPSTAKNLPSTLVPYKNYRQLSYRIKTTVNTAYRTKTIVNTAYRPNGTANTGYRPKATRFFSGFHVSICNTPHSWFSYSHPLVTCYMSYIYDIVL